MKTLIIDTSFKYLVIAIYENNCLLDGLQEHGNSRQSENAIPVIEKLLKKHNLSLFDMDELIVTIGPGSYTGVRVGLAIVKTLKTIHPYTIKVLSSLQALAGKKSCISVIDARSKKVFVGIYQNGKSIKQDALISIDDFDDYIIEYTNFAVIGDGVLVDKEVEEACIYQNIFDLKEELAIVEDIHKVVPDYIKEFEVTKK